MINAHIVIASVDSYLRFAEAVNRLDLTETERTSLEITSELQIHQRAALLPIALRETHPHGRQYFKRTTPASADWATATTNKLSNSRSPIVGGDAPRAAII
jgi:hypothetical protein